MTFWHSAAMSCVVAAAICSCACSTDEALHPGDTHDLIELTGDLADTAPADLDVAPAQIQLTPIDEFWTPPRVPVVCDICRPCVSSASCEPGELCANINGKHVCTSLCDAGTCPDGARCWRALDTGTNRASNVCLNPDADLLVCPASYSCGGTPDQDADLWQGDVPVFPCPEGNVCSYCGEPVGAVQQCPTSDTSPACEVFRLTNVERAQLGLPALTYNGALARSAQQHAIDMIVCDFFEHASLDGRDFADREIAAGYDAYPGGENIAAGQADAAEVMDAWMNSPGHRANILRDTFTELGVGFFEGDASYGNRWVQNFGVRLR